MCDTFNQKRCPCVKQMIKYQLYFHATDYLAYDMYIVIQYTSTWGHIYCMTIYINMGICVLYYNIHQHGNIYIVLQYTSTWGYVCCISIYINIGICILYCNIHQHGDMYIILQYTSTWGYVYCIAIYINMGICIL